MRLFLLTALVCIPEVALASSHALPYSYPYATLPAGGIEVEQYVDVTPVPALDTSGAAHATPRTILTTEIEYGLLDRLELGFYIEMSNAPGAIAGTAPLQFDGVKERLRLRLAEAGEWPVDVSLYCELAELATDTEIEGKVNLEKRLGALQLLVNLWGEYEFYYSGQREWVLNPTAGASYEITPTVHLGAEYWMHAEFGADVATGSFNPSPHSYLGPALMLQFNRLWWAVAPYVRLDNLSRPDQLGDIYGRFWVRTVIGIQL